MMVTDLRSWWQNHYVVDFFGYVGDFFHVFYRSSPPFTNISNMSPTHLVSNIDVAHKINFLDFKDVINGRDSWPFGGDGFTAGCRRSVGDNLFANYEGGTSFSVDQHSRFNFYTGKPFFEITFLKK